MGRKKKGYKSPEGLILIPNSKNWYIKKTVCGKEVFKSTGTADLIEAQKIYHAVMTELLKEASVHSVNRILGKSVPFSFLVERYLREISPAKSKNGVNDINSSKSLLKYFGESKIDGITKQDIYKYLDWRKNTISEKTAKVLSGATVNREKSFLSEIFTKAIRWGYVNNNTVIGLEGFSENRREVYLTDDTLKAILNNMKPVHSDIFKALYHTAQRPNRIYKLQWSQINLEERSITFQNTSKYSGPGFLGHDFMLKHMSKEAVKWEKMSSRPIHLKLSAGPSAAKRKSFFG